MTLIGPVQNNDRWGFLSPSGSWAIEPQFEVLGVFREGLAGFCEKGKLGFIDERGSVVIEPTFGMENPIAIWGFREGLAPVSSDCTKYIDRNGRIVLELPSTGTGRHFVEGRAVFMDFQGDHSVIDSTGKTLTTLPIFDAPFLPDWPENWECFTGWYKTDRLRAAAFNWKGEFVFEPKYAGLGEFFQGVAAFSADDNCELWGLVKVTGEIVLNPSLNSVGKFSGGLAPAANTRDEFGFVGTSGEWVIEPKFRQAQPFSEGLACVTVNDNTRRGKKGFINLSGEMIIEPHFDREASFHQGFAQVEYEGKYAVIDKSGRVIWETKIESDYRH